MISVARMSEAKSGTTPSAGWDDPDFAALHPGYK
jgi:hypothetical protein